MSAALVAEFRKLFSTRMWWLLGGLMVAYLAFIGVVMAFTLTVEQQGAPVTLTGVAAAEAVYGLVNAVGYVFPLLIGSLMMTTEFRHKTITESFLVEPRRGVLLAAKLVASVPIGLLYGVLGGIGVVAGGAPVLAWQGDGAFLGSGEVWETLALGVLVTTIWTIIGVAVGTVLPNQVAAIVVILALTQFVEPVARVALASFEATQQVSAYLPGAAADAVLGSSLFGEMAGAGGGALLSRGQGLAVFVAYAVVLAVVGRLTTLRRDVA